MPYFKTCPHCGAHLDPGEACDCIPSLYASLTPELRAKVHAKVSELLTEQKKAALSAANTGDGGVEQYDG